MPDAGVVFTGDLLFIEGTPIMWDGPVANWLTACDRIIELGARVIVPGHGPVTDESGVRDVQRYLTYVRDEARQRFEAGMDETAAADDIDLTDFRDWGDPERIAANVGDDLSRARPLAAGAHASRAVRADGPVERAPLMRPITLEEHYRAPMLSSVGLAGAAQPPPDSPIARIQAKLDDVGDQRAGLQGRSDQRPRSWTLPRRP